MANGPVDVRLELHPSAVLSRVWINGEQWAASVKRLSVDVEDAATIVTLSFYARLTAEGSLPLSPWPIEVTTEPTAGPPPAGALLVPARLLHCEWPPNDGVKPGNPRFDEVFASIREEGIKEPLTINANWLVIDGAHRLSAARLLGIERVPVRVWTGVEFVS